MAKVDKARKLENELISRGLTTALDTPQGRAVLWWLLSEAGVHQSAYANNALFMAFRAGKQEIGNQLLARILEADPRGYIRLQEERASPYVNRNASHSHADDYGDDDSDD